MGLPVILDASFACAIGFDPIGMILFDAGDDEALAKPLVIQRGVGAKFAGPDIFAAERTSIRVVWRGLCLEETAQVSFPNTHR